MLIVTSWALSGLAVTAAGASATEGTITRAHATPSWTHASIAGSVVFDDCALVPCGTWEAYAYATSLADDDGDGCQAYLFNKYVKVVWEAPAQTVDGSASFAFKKVPIVKGIVGQTLCVHVSTTRATCGPLVSQCGDDIFLRGREFCPGRNPCKQKKRSARAAARALDATPVPQEVLPKSGQEVSLGAHQQLGRR